MPSLRRHGRRAAVLACVAVGLALLALVGSVPHDGPLTLAVERVPLRPDDTAQDAARPLRYRGGLWLRSTDSRFGGLSDLRVSEDGSRLVALSDCGHAFTGTLGYDEKGRLIGLRDAHLHRLLAPGGRPVGTSEQDAESLAVDAKGRLLVGFEGRPRLWRYAAEPPLGGPPQPLPLPSSVSECGFNLGLEGAVTLEDDRILLIAEGPAGRPRTAPAWLGGGEAWVRLAYPLSYDADEPLEPFRPTGAARLPDGDVVVVERRYPPLAVRVELLPRAGLGQATMLAPREIARLDSPLLLDNFEGIEARRGPRGETLLYLLSDDGDCAKGAFSVKTGMQRTLLLMFALERS